MLYAAFAAFATLSFMLMPRGICRAAGHAFHDILLIVSSFFDAGQILLRCCLILLLLICRFAMMMSADAAFRLLAC